MKVFFRSVFFTMLSFSVLFLANVPLLFGDWNPVNTPHSPGARFGHSMVTLPDGQIMLFGGEDAGGDLFNDLFVFNNNDWNPVTATGSIPEPRKGQNMVVLPDGDIMIFAGEGEGGVLYNDLHIYDPDTGVWTEKIPAGNPPPPRTEACAEVVPANDAFVTFGGVGTDGNPRDDTWICSTYYYSTWYQRSDCPIATQGGATGAYDWCIYLGGYDPYLHIYDVGENKWTTFNMLPPFPEEIRNPAVCQRGFQVFLSGGVDGDSGEFITRTYVLDLDGKSWHLYWDEGISRHHASMSSTPWPDVQRKALSSRLILFGGLRSDWTVSSQTYEFVLGGDTSGNPWNYDYNGDGTSDIAVFRPGSGLWAIRGITRIYFGGSGDETVPGDYDADGTTDIGIFRPATGLWAVKGVTRAYFGSSSDIPVPLWLNPSSATTFGIFRPASGLWAVKGVTRAYFGSSGDLPIPGDYDGDGSEDLGIFRGTAGLWAIRGITRIYFGGSSDSVVPGEYSGDGTWEPAIFRPASGLWAIRGVTRSYFGCSIDDPLTADYNGDCIDDIGIFRESSGLWAIKGISRVYYGSSGDIPLTR